MKELKSQLFNKPLDADLHFEFSKKMFSNGSFVSALSEVKTAIYLGLKKTSEIDLYISECLDKIGDLEEIGYPLFSRMYSISNHIKKLIQNNSNISLLDIGGGKGWLAAFLPDVNYCLAEPKVNGISGENLPFAENSFDFVLSCHVLEHIPLENRELFVDSLMLRAKSAVILLNPFYVEETFPEERLNLVYEITQKDWVKEHIDCTLPTTRFIKNFCETRNFEHLIEPNGNKALNLSYIFTEYFAQKSKSGFELKKINKFFNSRYYNQITVDTFPTQYMITIYK